MPHWDERVWNLYTSTLPRRSSFFYCIITLLWNNEKADVTLVTWFHLWYSYIIFQPQFFIRIGCKSLFLGILYSILVPISIRLPSNHLLYEKNLLSLINWNIRLIYSTLWKHNPSNFFHFILKLSLTQTHQNKYHNAS